MLNVTTRVMTLTEVAQYLRIHRVTAYRLARRGTLPHFKVGSDYRFLVDAVDKWIVEQTVKRVNGDRA